MYALVTVRCVYSLPSKLLTLRVIVYNYSILGQSKDQKIFPDVQGTAHCVLLLEGNWSHLVVPCILGNRSLWDVPCIKGGGGSGVQLRQYNKYCFIILFFFCIQCSQFYLTEGFIVQSDRHKTIPGWSILCCGF